MISYAFTDTHFHAVILDESQAIKNHQAQVTQAVLDLKSGFSTRDVRNPD